MRPRFRRRLAPVLCCLVLCGARRAAAQQASTLPGSSSSAGPFQEAQRLVSDIFVGRNTAGPYLLSWKGIQPDGILVSRGPQRLQANVDYSLDPGLGVLNLTRPLKPNEIARVDYYVIDGKAMANAGGYALPVEFKLFDQGSSQLSMDAIIRPAPAGPVMPGGSPPPAQGMMLLGFKGASVLAGGSKLSSLLFLDSRGGSLKDRGAFKLSESTQGKVGQFSVNLTRAGHGFQGGQETQITAGLQVLEASAGLKPIHGIQPSASFRQTTELPAQGKGSVVTVIGQRLAGTLGSTRFQATHTDTVTNQADGTNVTRTADRVQLDQAIGSSTQATALVDRMETSTKDSGAVTQTSSITVKTQPLSALTLEGGFQNKLSNSGGQDLATLKVEATPSTHFKLSGQAQEKYSGTGAQHSRQASLEYAPDGAITLTGGFQVQASGASETYAGSVGATLKPVKFLEVSGATKQREALQGGVPVADTPDSYNVKVALQLAREALKLTGGYAENPEDDQGAVSRTVNRSAGLESKLGPLSFAGNYTEQQETLTSKCSTVIDLKLGWKFAPASQILTGYQESVTQDSGVLTSDTYTLSLTHHVGSILDFNLSGVLTTHEKDGILQPITEYKAEAKLGLHF